MEPIGDRIGRPRWGVRYYGHYDKRDDCQAGRLANRDDCGETRVRGVRRGEDKIRRERDSPEGTAEESDVRQAAPPASLAEDLGWRLDRGDQTAFSSRLRLGQLHIGATVTVLKLL